jgi:transposase
VGRKNWLFSATPDGAHASATFYSLIETAKANKIEPNAYLRFLFERIYLVKNPDGFKKLLPQYLDKSLLPQPG